MELLQHAYDPEAFRRDGHGLIDQLADYLAAALRGDLEAVLPPLQPEALRAHWTALLAAGAPATLEQLIGAVLAQSNHLHHPGYLGHQVSPVLPHSTLLELVGKLLNNGMAVFEMGPAATAMERVVIDWMAGTLRLGPRAGGVLTSGGSLGNLTALLAARQRRAGFDIWQRGAGAGPRLAVLCSDQCHYSVERAVCIMGLGRDGAVAVPSDEGFRMRRDALEQAYRETRARGFQVVAVVASACSTAAGVFDPLDEIAAFCRTHDLWLHVDGAHGAAAALSRRYRHLVDGIEQADSVVWDAHKMLMMPALVSAVLFRDGADARAAFAQEASYLYAATSDEGWHDIGTRTLECTKRTMSLTLYGTLLTGGEELFTGNVERLFDLARELADLLGGAPDFELPVAPQANIVCFRHCPNGAALAPEELDRLQAYLRAAVLQGGRHYIVQTRLRGALYLRVTVMNPFSDRPVQAALIDELRRHGRAWLENGRP